LILISLNIYASDSHTRMTLTVRSPHLIAAIWHWNLYMFIVIVAALNSSIHS